MKYEADVLSLANSIRVGAEPTGANLEDTGNSKGIEDLHALHGVDVRLARVASALQVGAKALGWQDVSAGGGHNASPYKVAIRPMLPYLRGESKLRMDPETRQITLYTWCKAIATCDVTHAYRCRKIGTWDLNTSRASTIAASILGAVATQAAHDAIQHSQAGAEL